MKKIIDFVANRPVLITAFIFILFYFIPIKPKPFGDGDFHTGTIQLIEYLSNNFEGEIRVNKGMLTLVCYLIPYAIVYPFKNDSFFLFSSIAFSLIFVCLSVNFIFKAIDLLKVSNKQKAIIILLLSLFPIHIYYAMGVIGEVFAFFASSLWLYFWVKISFSKNKIKLSDFIFLGLSLILLYGTKPIFIPFIGVFSIYMFFFKSHWRNKLAFFLTIAIIPLLIFIESKSHKHGQEFKQYAFRSQILWSRYELRDEPFNWIPQHGKDEFSSTDYLNNRKKRIELDSICTVNGYDRNEYFIKWVLNDIADNPLLTLRQYSLKFFQSQSFIISPLIKSKKSPFIKYSIHIYINLINFLLVFVGVFTMFKLQKVKNYKLFFPFLFFWGSALCYVFLLHSEQRYMFPFRPILIFLFAYWFHMKNEKSLDFKET
jgi:hypothetical protein